MSQDTLAIPQVAAAAAGRALQFTIAELSQRLKAAKDRHLSQALESEMLAMQDAHKALFSAIPFCTDVIPSLQHRLKIAQSTTEDLHARLIERTEQSMDTALRDAETIRELREALKGVVRIADRKTDEFDRARAALAKAEPTPSPTSESPRGA